MMSTEERLRAATRAAADTVPPGNAPPLRLPPEPAGHLGRGRRRRWLGAMTPLAAAAAVAAVVIASPTLTPDAHRPPGGTDPARSGALSSVPPYYVALTSQAAPARVVIRATATGAVVATVKPPKPYGTFTFVTGAADDRTFVLAAQRWWPIASGTRGLAAEKRDNTTAVVFFRLRFDPATGSAGLIRLSRLPAPQSTQLGGIGLSPDGTRLALDLDVVTTPGGSGQPALRGPGIQVVTLATGSLREWAWPGAGWVGNTKPLGQPLSWTADGRTLAFQEWKGNNAQIRLLDTTAPSSDLRSSRLVRKFPDGYGVTTLGLVSNSLITPDGTTLVTANARYQRHPVRSGLQISEFDARTGAVTHALARWRLSSRGQSWQDVLWTSSSGRTLIVTTPPGTGPGTASLDRPLGPVTGILTRDGQFTPLPGLSTRSTNIAW
jgi:hypothetical protein